MKEKGLKIFGVLVGDRWESALENFEGKNGERVSIKGKFVGAELVKNDSEGPHISLSGVRLPFYHLRTEVVRRPYHGGSCKLGAVKGARDSKVSDLNLLILAEEDVGSLQIAMDDLPS